MCDPAVTRLAAHTPPNRGPNRQKAKGPVATTKAEIRPLGCGHRLPTAESPRSPPHVFESAVGGGCFVERLERPLSSGSATDAVADMCCLWRVDHTYDLQL